jgi:glycosyltransferase involved in cell wall biosynthesis
MGLKIAFLIQRYGAEVMGGSELHCAMIAERLAARGCECTVYTTTAKDYVTWQPDYLKGETVINGVRVKRYDVLRARDIASFNAFSDRVFFHPHAPADELEWMERQGPYSPALIQAVEREAGEHDRWVFFTYLYYNTYWGLKAVPGPKTLVPTAHDEPALRLGIMREVFERPAAFMFNTEAEKAMLARHFSFAGKLQETVGVGVDVPDDPASWPIAGKYRDLQPYVLYAGRIEPGKGCAEMFDYFIRAAARRPRLRLLLIGKLLMPLPEHPRIHYLGFVPPEEKTAAMALARATIHPSHFESLCMAALESLAVRTPILVQAATDPLRQHCLQGNAGLFFANADEFDIALDWLVRDDRLRQALGRNGLAYVRENYTWDRVLDKYERVFKALTSWPSLTIPPTP